MVARYFPQDEYEERWRRVQAEMARIGLDVLVIWGRSPGTYCRAGDVVYLVNYYGNGSGQGLDTPLTNARGFAAVIMRKGEPPELLSDEPWPRMDLITTDRVSWSRDPVMAVAEALGGHNATGKIGLVGTDFLP